eukprot:UN20573
MIHLARRYENLCASRKTSRKIIIEHYHSSLTIYMMTLIFIRNCGIKFIGQFMLFNFLLFLNEQFIFQLHLTYKLVIP